MGDNGLEAVASGRAYQGGERRGHAVNRVTLSRNLLADPTVLNTADTDKVRQIVLPVLRQLHRLNRETIGRGEIVNPEITPGFANAYELTTEEYQLWNGLLNLDGFKTDLVNGSNIEILKEGETEQPYSTFRTEVNLDKRENRRIYEKKASDPEKIHFYMIPSIIPVGDFRGAFPFIEIKLYMKYNDEWIVDMIPGTDVTTTYSPSRLASASRSKYKAIYAPRQIDGPHLRMTNRASDDGSDQDGRVVINYSSSDDIGRITFPSSREVTDFAFTVATPQDQEKMATALLLQMSRFNLADIKLQ